jgi:hypothetical protein
MRPSCSLLVLLGVLAGLQTHAAQVSGPGLEGAGILAALRYPPSSYVLPAATTYAINGDSKIAQGVAFIRPSASGGGATNGTTWNAGVGYLLGPWANYAFLDSPTGGYAVASTTTCRAVQSFQPQPTVAGNYATTTNPCFSGPGNAWQYPMVAAQNPGNGGAAAETHFAAQDQEINPNAMGSAPADLTGIPIAPENDNASDVIYLNAGNDGSSGSFAGSRYSTASHVSGVTSIEQTMLDEYTLMTAYGAANKHIFLMDGMPFGYQTVISEPHAVPASSPAGYTFGAFCSSTGSGSCASPKLVIPWDDYGDLPSGFTSGGVYDAQGNVYTLVTTCGTTPWTYTVTQGVGGGTYVLCTAPIAGGTQIFINYDYSPTGALTGSQYLFEVHRFEDSSAAQFTSPLCTGTSVGGGNFNCQNPLTGGPLSGELYNHPFINVVHSWAASQEVAAGSETQCCAAFGSTDYQLGVHPYPWDAMRVADQYVSVLHSVRPTLTVSLANFPVANNIYICRPKGTSATIDSANASGACNAANPAASPAIPAVGPLPLSMRGAACTSTTPFAMDVTVNGVPVAVSNGAGGWVLATTSNSPRLNTITNRAANPVTNPFTSASGTYNCSTGAWSITLNADWSNNSIVILEQDLTNIAYNGLMDATYAVANLPTNFTAATGGTAGTPIGWAFSASTCLANSLAGTGVTAADALSGVAGTPSATITVQTNASGTPATVTDADGTWPSVRVIGSGILAGTGCGVNADSLKLVQMIEAPGDWLTTANNDELRGGVKVQIAPGPNGHLQGLLGLPAAAFLPFTGNTYIPPWTAFEPGSLTGQVLAGSSGSIAAAVQLTDLIFYKGVPLQLPELTPIISDAGFTQSTIGAVQETNSVQIQQGVPFSFTADFYRSQLRIRTGCPNGPTC